MKSDGGNDKRSWLQQYSAEQERKYREEREANERRNRVLDAAWKTIHRVDAIVNRPIKGVL